MSISRNRGRTDTTGRENSEIISNMTQIARRYRQRGSLSDTELQDFNSLRQALNCASADQRLLVVVNVPDSDRHKIERKLKPIFADPSIIGRFHLNFVNPTMDGRWTDLIHGAIDKPSLLIVHSSRFGLDGESIEQLPLDADQVTVKQSLMKTNAKFAKNETRKDYEEHVRTGKRQRIFFENEISRRGSQDGPASASGPGGRPPRRRR